MSNNSNEAAKQTARKSTSRPTPQRQPEAPQSTVLVVRPRESSADLAPRRAIDPIAKTYLKARQRFNQQQRNFGVGTGKGGIKRLAQVMKRRTSSEPRRMALSDLRLVQRQREYSIPLIHMTRAIKEILTEICRGQPHWRDGTPRLQIAAIGAIRDAAESHMVNFFELCSFLTTHARRVTLMSKDLALATRLKHWSAAKEGRLL